MDPHPDFAGVDWPRSMAVGPFAFTPLSPDQVDEDLAAVLAAAPVLDGIFGPVWPTGLTREANLIDLAWHDREFTARRSFAWIIRDGAGAYLGCFYLYPAMGTRGRAQAVFWLCDMAERQAVAAQLRSALDIWLVANLPTGIALSWLTRPVLE
jgi:hypothetical protein